MIYKRITKNLAKISDIKDVVMYNLTRNYYYNLTKILLLYNIIFHRRSINVSTSHLDLLVKASPEIYIINSLFF